MNLPHGEERILRLDLPRFLPSIALNLFDQLAPMVQHHRIAVVKLFRAVQLILMRCGGDDGEACVADGIFGSVPIGAANKRRAGA